MEWPIILLLVLAVPVILLPVALVWYLNIGALYAAIKERRKERAAHEAGEPRTHPVGVKR